MTVHDIDHGWKRIKKELHLAKNSYTKVGIQHDAGKNEGVSIAEYAANNEFGVPERYIPARPFMRSAFDMSRNKIKKIQTSQYDKILQGHSTVKKSLAILGEYMEGQVKKRITDIKTPKNKLSTILAKSNYRKPYKTNPLIDTGMMRASVRHVEVINDKTGK